MTKIDYLLVGHATADLVEGGRTLGGTVTYGTPVVRAFGHRVGVVTSAAACEPLMEHLAPLANVVVHMAEATTTFRNTYKNGTRTQTVYSVAAPLSYDSIPFGWTDAPLVHLAPLVNEVDPQIVKHFRDQTVLLTPQGYMREWGEDGQVHFKRWLDSEMLADVNILVLSNQDIAEAPELEQEYARLVEWVFVTEGEHGGAYYHNGERKTYAAVPSNEVDPTGAGDVFAAALLSSLLRYDMDTAVRSAAHLAAQSVTAPGVYPFTEQEVQAALHYGTQDAEP